MKPKGTIRYTLTSSAPPRYFLGDEEVTKEQFLAVYPGKPLEEAAGVAATNPRWPFTSRAAGVHRTQAVEASAHAAALGVPTEFTPTGEAVMRDKAHRRAFLKAHGMRDNDAGYSDG